MKLRSLDHTDIPDPEDCYITMNCHDATPVITSDIYELADKAIRKCGNKGSVAMPRLGSKWWLTITDRPIKPVPDNKSFIETLERSLAAHTLMHMRSAASASRDEELSLAGNSQLPIRPTPRWG